MNYFRHLMNIISENTAIPEDDFNDVDKISDNENSAEEIETPEDDSLADAPLEEATAQLITSREKALDKSKEIRKTKSLLYKEQSKRKSN